jgi:hypothetical protein
MDNSMGRHSNSTAAAVAAKVGRARRRFFRREDFEGPASAIDRELSRLAAAGELMRIRRGLYWRGPRTMLGMTPPTERELLNEVLAGKTYGWTGVSAANRLGLTSQVAGRTKVAVVGRPPRDLDSIEFVQRSGCRARDEAGLSPEEVAVLEALADLEDLAESPDAARARLAQLLRDGVVRAAALRDAVEDERPVVRRRLEELLGNGPHRLLAASS